MAARRESDMRLLTNTLAILAILGLPILGGIAWG